MPLARSSLKGGEKPASRVTAAPQLSIDGRCAPGGTNCQRPKVRQNTRAATANTASMPSVGPGSSRPEVPAWSRPVMCRHQCAETSC